MPILIMENTQPSASALAFYLRAALEWIDAIPKDVADSLPAMPGLDRDDAESLLASLTTPVSDGRISDAMRSYIEGMSVSVDVSTCDADAGNRYFGTVTEVMDDDGDKHGVTLLVQSNVQANFQTQPSASALSDTIRKALSQAYWFGQTYWRQADSERASDNLKSEVTRQQYDAFVEETIDALPAPVSEPIAWARRRKDGKLSSWLFDSKESAESFGSDRYKAIPVFDKPQAVVAQPVDADIARKAARYDWLVENCFDWAVPGDGDSFDHIELHFEHALLGRDDASVGEAIDSEIAREQSPQAKAGDKHD